MPQNIYELLWLFIIYAFLGWCVEVAYQAVVRGEFVNRGFLNGPWCPIYGFGMLLLIEFLYPLRRNALILFLGTVIFTTTLEFLTGLILEKAFHSRWWDYSDMPYNIKGYVCLSFSLIWGFGGTFVVALVHPAVYGLVALVPQMVGTVLLVLVLIAFAVDCVVTVQTILKFNRKLRAIEEFSQGLRKVSDEIGENIFENVEAFSDFASEAQLALRENAMEARSEYEYRRGELRENMNEARGEYEQRLEKMHDNVQEAREEQEQRIARMRDNAQDVRKEYVQRGAELLEKLRGAATRKIPGEKRLLKAFPQVKLIRHEDALLRYKNFLKRREEEEQAGTKSEASANVKIVNGVSEKASAETDGDKM